MATPDPPPRTPPPLLLQVVVDDASCAQALLEKGRLTQRVTIIPLDKVRWVICGSAAIMCALPLDLASNMHPTLHS